jgi:hypothetical protein
MRITKVLTDNGKAFTDRLFGLRKRAATGQHEFDLLCAELGIERRLAPPMRPQTNCVVELFDGRIEDVLHGHCFQSGEDFEQTILRYVHLYNSQLPQSVLKGRSPVEALKDWRRKKPELFRKRVYNHAECFNYALSLVPKILATPRQELASHTFFHDYAFDPGQTRADFAEDLPAAKRAAGRLGIEMHSLVFPWNQHNAEYLSVCRDEGFIVIRSIPGASLYTGSARSEDNVPRRVDRLADTHSPLTKDVAASVCEPIDGVVAVPASRFLRSVNGKTRVFERHRPSRITRSITATARSGGLFHLWWHPHDFGLDTQDDLDFLRRALDLYSLLKDSDNLRSLSIGEVAKDHVAMRRASAA